jgi:hypothetical protein
MDDKIQYAGLLGVLKTLLKNLVDADNFSFII